MTSDLHERAAVLIDDECGHVVVEVDGEQQHHDIPDDGAPHAATGECGCAPHRYEVNGYAVYEHADQDLIADADVYA